MSNAVERIAQHCADCTAGFDADRGDSSDHSHLDEDIGRTERPGSRGSNAIVLIEQRRVLRGPVHAVMRGMKRTRVTIVPAFDVAEFAHTSDDEPPPSCATIVPTFNMEQYAQTVSSTSAGAGTNSMLAPMSDSDTPEEHSAVGSAPTTPAPPTVVAVSGTSPAGQPLQDLLAETPIRCRQADTSDLSHRAMFILLHVDGICTVQDIVARCGVPRIDALETLALLFDRGILCIRNANAKQTDAPPSGIGERACRSDRDPRGLEVNRRDSRVASK
jgi:hypothetical protein